ncbi:hypothetical protein EYC84_005989 [Monilinia fructicola]|uniref:Uncharacterized protein n=1 Tax=Monilinia fructicola TaxID=38448 RepID=A0A5M9K0Y8_MONFR|nr:hypothetical protein EYC84_005989 [Monilinia fructicola]
MYQESSAMYKSSTRAHKGKVCSKDIPFHSNVLYFPLLRNDENSQMTMYILYRLLNPPSQSSPIAICQPQP